MMGERPGALDAYALTLLRWGGFAGIDPTTQPATWDLAQRFAALPPVARAVEREADAQHLQAQGLNVQAGSRASSGEAHRGQQTGGLRSGCALSISTVAPCCCAISCTMVRPRPEPSTLVPSAR